ncbi:DUF1778 domain-containing protein [Rhodoligotrophos defluvii]|uniref:type II toxin-antitoxin system TacA family antitoxin n=1 Tax=Rhodoligotrophos defluvii TaxID=2561934 RepID=UPI003D16A04B
MIDRAASLRGRSRTDFVRDAAVRAAEEVVMEQGLIRMSPEGFAEFMDVLARPAAPVPEMVEVLKRPAPWEPGYVAGRHGAGPDPDEPGGLRRVHGCAGASGRSRSGDGGSSEAARAMGARLRG